MMEQTLRRAGSGIVIGLYLVWLLAVVALLITRFTPGPVPTVVDWVVVAGAGIGFLIGSIQIISRTPQYVEKVSSWLSSR